MSIIIVLKLKLKIENKDKKRLKGLKHFIREPKLDK